MKKILSALVGNLLLFTLSYAQIEELEATPSIMTEIGATFRIIEANFKHKEQDFIRMRYFSPSGKPLDLKGVGFGDDTIFKTIATNTMIASGQELLLTFKGTQTDSIPYLYSARTGLTGTTEQFIVYDPNGEVLDALCWTSSAPTTSEISDMAELYEQEGWNSADVTSCISSEAVGTSESIFRKDGIDTNAATDWIMPGSEPQSTSGSSSSSPTVTPQPTKIASLPASSPSASSQNGTSSSSTSQPSVIALATTDQEVEVDETPDLVPLPKSSSTSTTSSKTAKKSSTSKKTSVKSYPNGDLSMEIAITEVLPNPEKEDTKNEWIEVTNLGESTVNLGNWQLDDDENGSKPYAIPNNIVLEPGAAHLFPVTETHLSLGNTSDRVRIFDYEGTLIHEVEYTEAPSGKSYALINILKEDGEKSGEWLWVEELSPGEPNAALQELTGEVVSEAEFGTEYSFQVKILHADATDGESLTQSTDKSVNGSLQNAELKTILFDEAVVAAPLAKISFTKGAKVKLLVEPEDDGRYRLKKYGVLEASTQQDNNNLPLIVTVILGILLCGGLGAYWLIKKAPWQKTFDQKTERPSSKNEESRPSLLHKTAEPAHLE